VTAEQTRPRVLVIGRHAEVLGRVLTALARAGYDAVGHIGDADALASMQSERVFDALVVGGGVEPASRPHLVDAFLRANPSGKIIEHFGGTVGLLEAITRAVGVPPASTPGT
jgi:hypothetical protein